MNNLWRLLDKETVLKYTSSHLKTFIIEYCDITGHDAVLVITDNHCQEKLPLQNKILNNMKYIRVSILQVLKYSIDYCIVQNFDGKKLWRIEHVRNFDELTVAFIGKVLTG